MSYSWILLSQTLKGTKKGFALTGVQDSQQLMSEKYVLWEIIWVWDTEEFEITKFEIVRFYCTNIQASICIWSFAFSLLVCSYSNWVMKPCAFRVTASCYQELRCPVLGRRFSKILTLHLTPPLALVLLLLLLVF